MTDVKTPPADRQRAASSRPATHRPIRSFVRREGRITPGQQRAFEHHYGRFGVADESSPIDFDALFGRRAERVLEIGFGDGESLLAQAAARADADFLGVEVHRPGVGRLLNRLADAGLDNVRVLYADAAEVLRRRIADASLDRVQIFFPDPWHKKRHHKRRLLQPAFAALLTRRLADGGVLHLATDWQPYAEQMLDVLDGVDALRNAAGDGFAPRPPTRPLTKFERRGLGQGHQVWDLLFRRAPRAGAAV